MTKLPEEIWIEPDYNEIVEHVDYITALIERERGYELREDENVSEAVLVYVKKLKSQNEVMREALFNIAVTYVEHPEVYAKRRAQEALDKIGDN